MKLLPLLITFLFSLTAKADDFLLSKLVNGVDGTESAVILETQNGQAQNIVFSDYITRFTFSFSELSQQELPIITYNGQDVLLMECAVDCNSSTGGTFAVRYLYNGLFGTYYTIFIWLKKTDTGWLLHDNKYRRITAITISPRYMAGSVIGINIAL